MNFKNTFLASWMSRGLIVLAALLVGYNTVTYSLELLKAKNRRQKTPYVFLGQIFSGLESTLKGSKRIGYITDRDIEKNDVDNRRFSQGQYVLAPIILDLNNTQHEFLIFDFKNPLTALNKIKEMGAVPLKGNQFGVMIVRNPHAAAASENTLR